MTYNHNTIHLMDFDEFDVDVSDTKVCEFVSRDTSSLYVDRCLYDKTYTDETENYKILRKNKIDPITHKLIDPEIAFSFPLMWNYDGDISCPDPYGPLSFNCDNESIVRYLFERRLFKLYQLNKYGYDTQIENYDIGLGMGEDFFISGRGKNPNWYAFRLPVADCYLEEAIKFIPMTPPKLTEEHVQEINKKYKIWCNKYNHGRGLDLMEMYKQYHNAISLCKCEGTCFCFNDKKKAVLSLIKMVL